jgi:hypothetical protein
MQGVKGEIIKPRRAWVGLVPAQTKKQIEEKKKKKEKKEPRWVGHCRPGQLGSGPPHIFNYNIILLFKKSSNIFF